MKFGNINTLWAAAFVDELARSGVRDLVVSPGSRSTPLVLAAAAHPDVRDWSVIDERSAGFFALGLIRGAGRPVALVCTSGTAAANYLPAICEADASGLGLIVVTADRPASLQDTGASQAMDQKNLYGSRVRWFHQTGQPEATDADLRYVRELGCKAVARAVTGPVHINMPLRKPLENTQVAPDHRDSIHALDLRALGAKGRPGHQPFVRLEVPRRAPGDSAELMRLLGASQRPIVLAGADSSESVGQAARRLEIPVLAEATSGLAPAVGASPVGARASHAPRLSPDFAVQALATQPPDLVIITGRWPVDWPTIHWLNGLEATPIVWVGDVEANPEHRSGTRVSVQTFCEVNHDRDETWRQWLENATRAHRVPALAKLPKTLFDGAAAFLLSRVATQDDAIVVSSSMPLRDIELYYEGPARVFANRGLNGIDGVLSTAAGVAAARGGITYVLIGDVAFAHDLGGLAAIRAAGQNITIVLINNEGGAIFDYLPVADASNTFERHFTTSPNIDFSAICAGFGLVHRKATTWADLEVALGTNTTQVVEVMTSSAVSAKTRQEVLLLPFSGPDLGPIGRIEFDAEPVIALHGFTGTRADWKPLMACTNRPLTAIDLPGHGSCETEVGSMQDCVEYVARTLDGLGAEKCHLLGYSMGGRVALAFAATYPDRVKSLVTIGASAGIQDVTEREQRRKADQLLAHELRASGLHKFVDSWMAHPLFASQQTLGAAWRRNSREARLSQSAEGLASALEAYGTGSQPGYWTRLDIAAPCLHLAGELDTKFRALAERLADATDGISHIIKNAGHAAHFEQPEAVAKSINGFWKDAL